MRITQNMMTSGYLKRMNGNLAGLTGSNERMASGRSFMKSHENISSAGRALMTRRAVENNQRFQDTVRDLRGRATMAEDSLRTVSSLMHRANDSMIAALNGTLADDDRQKIASELEAAQNEVLQIMNSKFGDKFLFDAAGNKDGSVPFVVDGTGKLTFNGTQVDGMSKDPITGNITSGGADIPFNSKNFVDIGFGFQLDATGQRIDSNTAFQDSYSGVESFGFGVNADGVPLNAFSLLGEMTEKLRMVPTDRTALAKCQNAISDSMNFMLTSITEIGARGVTLDNTASRLENEFVTLAETQQKLEGVDLSKEAIRNKQYEMSWMVTLQLGSKILPTTIFDFLR